jgi:small-conductance mechanosensitive channel
MADQLNLEKILMLVGTAVGVMVVTWVVLKVAEILLARSVRSWPDDFHIVRRFYVPTLLFLLGSLLLIDFKVIHLVLWAQVGKEAVVPYLRAGLILLGAVIVGRALRVAILCYYERFDISHPDNLLQRKARTRLQFVEKTLKVVIWIITAGLIFLNFKSLQKVGGSLLASAGLASIVIGFAAQKSLANLIAGFQIAFTQPIRVEDAVYVEGVWGWVEEIALTYVVVRAWDQRRLVLPITYFTTKPFQNWTRTTAQILGSVYLYVDYKTDIPALRKELDRILDDTHLWDKDKKVLQVVDVTEKTVVLRALMTGKDSPTTWDLRCHVREKLVEYLKENYPKSFPLMRVEMEGSEPEKASALPATG